MSIKNISLFSRARLWAAVLFCFFGLTVVAGDFGAKKNPDGRIPRFCGFGNLPEPKKRKMNDEEPTEVTAETSVFQVPAQPITLNPNSLPKPIFPDGFQLPVPSFDKLAQGPNQIKSIQQPLKGGRISITAEQVYALLDRKFQNLEKIGTGDQGTVFKGRNGEKWYAFKVFKNLPAKKKKLDREVEFAQLLSDNHHVLKYLEYGQNGDFLYIKTNLFSQDLAKYLEQEYQIKNASLPEDILWGYIADIALGLSSFESLGLVHMDIKPENLFLDENGHIVIGDFGLVTVLKELSEDNAKFETGDARYIALELMDDKISHKCDIASFGFCVLHMATLIDLPRCDEAWKLIRQENGVQSYLNNTHYSDELKDLISSMTNPNIEERPSASAILEMARVKAILQARNH